MVKVHDKLIVQAEQGSVAALIQVLNHQLATSGVRVRAVLVRGVLQLLCEATDAARLERHQLVQRIRQILESLHPRHIRRVRINSRIVKEQQLLWLDEISRDPNGQLLWSEEILLARPNPIKQWVNARQDSSRREEAILSLSTVRHRQAKQQFWRGLWGGTLLGMGVLVVGWSGYSWLQQRASDSAAVVRPAPNAPSSSPEQPGDLSVNSVSPSNAPRSSTLPNEARPNDINRQPDAPMGSERFGVAPAEVQPGRANPRADAPADAFATAVRLAEQAAAEGRTASTTAEWLDIASAWQRASGLMGQVPSDDSRYRTAQDRYRLYQQYANEARSQAERRPAQ